MKRLPVPDYFGHTLFCDDIRQEVDGKVTYVGVYTAGEMVFSIPFPVTLPKLGIAITLAISAKVLGRYTVQVFLPGDSEDKPSIVLDTPDDAGTSELPSFPGEDADSRHGFKLHGVFSPVTFLSEGYVEVRAVKDGESLRVGRLKITNATRNTESKTS